MTAVSNVPEGFRAHVETIKSKRGVVVVNPPIDVTDLIDVDAETCVVHPTRMSTAELLARRPSLDLDVDDATVEVAYCFSYLYRSSASVTASPLATLFSLGSERDKTNGQ